ncbi:MAG: carboxypeptidase [Rhizobiales bacterium]|nr:carboxypeptidase [Hyphomicrobiales bacterium]
MRNRGFLALILAVLLLAPTAAQERPDRGGTPAAARADSGVLRLLPPDAVTERTVDTASTPLTYTATAGTLPLYDQSGGQSAAIFYTAYVAKGMNPANRPLTFVFNGGPGAASAFLHLGLAGPRIVDFGEGASGAATPRLRDNPQTWLEFTDLVMIDPVGAGWSRPAKPDGGKAFWGVQNDAQTIAKVIALYVARNSRTSSPKYLLGESYGGFRAAKVARAVQREQGIIISGIVMVSPMLEGHFQFGGKDYALGAALALPSLIATELERKNADSAEAMAAAERFAMTEYLTALAGPPLQGEAARSFYRRLAEMTGLPVDVVTRSRGFIHDDYVKHHRAADRKIVSRYDATHAVADPFPENDGAHGPDPGLDGFIRALGSVFVGYARDELGYKTDVTYSLLASGISGNWDWGSRRSPPGVSDDLRLLLAFDPAFRLLVIHGRSDLVTPYGVSRYVIDRLPPDTADRAHLKVYRGGHMLYLDDGSRKAMTKDAKAFYRRQ